MKKILIVADEPNWIFARHALEIKKRLIEYGIDITYHNQNIPEISKQYGLIYVMDPMPLRHGYPPKEKTILGLRADYFWRENPAGAKGTYENGYRCESIKNKCCIFHVVNKNSYEAFKPFVTNKPLLLVQHGVDEVTFDRNKYSKVNNDILTASISGRGSNNKGFEIIVDACNKAGVKYLSASYDRNKLTKDQMPLFYSKVDVHICMSKNEGLNNPTLEAGAMGVPVITTRCGAAEEMIIDERTGLIIDRNIDGLIGALNKMKNKEYRESMGNGFYEEIMKNWTWKTRIEDFRKMFGKFFSMAESNALADNKNYEIFDYIAACQHDNTRQYYD